MYKHTEAQKKRLVAWALCRRQASEMQCMRDTKCRVVEHSVSVVFGALLKKRPEVSV